jgi:LysR family hydrogen peroxide-inducible transcriptional activator
MPTLKQLRYFAALARERHFGRAAEACAVTQPALSMQIKELEAELGVVLVERRAGSVAPTDIGSELARRAEGVLSEVRDMVELARGRREPLDGLLRLGIIPSIAPYLLPLLLPKLQERFPRLDLEVQESRTAMLVEALQRGEVDAVLLALPAPDATAFESRALFEDEFYVAVPAGTHRAWAATADMHRRLAAERLLLLEEGHCLRDQALQFCGIERSAHRALGATSLATIVQMVAAGYGVTLVPALAVRAEVTDPRVALLRFDGNPPRRTIGLAWRRGSARARDAEALTQMVLEMMRAGALTDPPPGDDSRSPKNDVAMEEIRAARS